MSEVAEIYPHKPIGLSDHSSYISGPLDKEKKMTDSKD